MAKTKTLHPALQQRATQVKQAHETLKSNPDYQALPPAGRFRATQALVKARTAKK